LSGVFWLEMKALLALLVAAVALAAAVPALAKDGVKATLHSSIPLDAPAGTPLHVSWTLAYADEQGRRHPFGAGGVFVRLVSASGAPAEAAYARQDEGSYKAIVTVPSGGIGDIEFGVQGFTSGAAGSHRADALFPITNDPIAAAPHSVHSSSGSATWIYVSAAGLVSLATLAGLYVSRRTRVAA
jgi:hypothetical protein